MAQELTYEELSSGKYSRFRFAFLRLRQLVAQSMDRFPHLFLRVLHRSGSTVNGETEIVIDGYPRSASTFACLALDHCEGRKVNRAAFKHYSSQIILGVKMAKPVLLLVRRPEDAVVSLRISNPWYGMGQLLRRWVVYHRRVKPYRDGFVVATFDQVTEDFGSVIERVNRRFGTDFQPFCHTEENLKEVFAAIDQFAVRVQGRVIQSRVCRPSDDRKEMKKSVQAELTLPNNERLLQEANRLYEEFASYAEESAALPSQAGPRSQGEPPLPPVRESQ